MGVVIAAAFLAFGVTRVLPDLASVTLGARIVLFPGAAALMGASAKATTNAPAIPDARVMDVSPAAVE